MSDLVERLRKATRRFHGSYARRESDQCWLGTMCEQCERLRSQLADAETVIAKLNGGEELQTLMKINNDLRAQLVAAEEARLNDINAMGMMEVRAGAAEAKLASARKGIQDYLDGDYPHPRSFRPGLCPHGLYYYNECEQCTDDHFEKVLSSLTSAQGEPK